jgi:hypothetical protein
MVTESLKRGLPLLVCTVFLLAGIVLAVAGEKTTTPKKKTDHKKAFAVYKQKCLLCHDSVADPEKPGRTQDEWLLDRLRNRDTRGISVCTRRMPSCDPIP